jgi:small-conductance mechanosensitive channel
MLETLQQHPWAATLLAALLAVMAAMFVHRLGLVVVRRVTGGKLVLQSLIAGTERASSAVLPLAALQVVWQAADDAQRSIGVVRHANGVLLIAAITWLAVSAISGLAAGVVRLHPATEEDNLNARRVQTQTLVLARTAMVIAVIAGASMALMTFPGARHVGASLLASAGVVGLVAGIAARPVFSNLIAGLQLAVGQPLRIDDVLNVKGEQGRVEEITGTYVVLKLWDERRMIIPLQWFIENTFENWTRTSSAIHLPVYLLLTYTAPLAPLRAEMERIVQAAPQWDGRTARLDVVDTTEGRMKVRILISGRDATRAFDLGCQLREELLAFLKREHPDSLP